MRLLITLVVVLLGLFTAVAGQATTVTVPGDFPTIQEALSASSAGDTILVAPGTYSGPGNRALNFLGKDMVLRSVGGPSVTTLDCEGLNNAFNFVNGETRGAVVCGFRIVRGSAHHGGGIRCSESSPTVADCVFTFNQALYSGGAIECVNWSSPLIQGCEFRANTSEKGGALNLKRSNADVVGCVLESNDCSNLGAAVFVQLGSPVFEDCRFASNSAEQGASTLYVSDGGSVEVRMCEFADNNDHVITLGDASQGVLRNCTIDGNGGMGLIVAGGSQVDAQNLIVTFGSSGRGIWCADDSTVALMCCDIYGNAGGDWIGNVAGQFGVGGNICADPLFCREDNPENPLTLDATSPCAPEQTGLCGLIGLHGVGCGFTPVEERSWGEIKGGYR